jgi:hypothetical protein
MFGFIKKFENNSKIKKPRVKRVRAKVAKTVDGHVNGYFTDRFEPDKFEPDWFEPDTITFDRSIELARSEGVSEDEIIHNLEECDKYFMN